MPDGVIFTMDLFRTPAFGSKSGTGCGVGGNVNSSILD